VDRQTAFLYNHLMRARPRGGGTAFDWVIRATRWQHHLSETSPVFCHHPFYALPQPLELDVHGDMELGIVLAGEVERHYEKCVLRCQPGDVWLCAMWEPHGRRVIASGTEIVVFMFLPAFLGEETLGEVSWLDLFAVAPDRRPRVAGPEMRAQMLAAGRELRRESEERGFGWISAVRLQLLGVVLALSRARRLLQHTPDGLAEPRRVRAYDLSRVMPAVDEVHRHPDHRITADEAAAICRLSRSHFDRIFGHTMGMGFGEFCLRARVAFAAHRLLTTELSVEDVAAEAGFSDGSHLHRVFVARYGCTPATYRRQAG